LNGVEADEFMLQLVQELHDGLVDDVDPEVVPQFALRDIESLIHRHDRASNGRAPHARWRNTRTLQSRMR
jgi:hypothetical protein